MTDRELMQMALDALESSRVFVTSREQIKHPEGTEWYDERIEALRARLAQPEPEPWGYISHKSWKMPVFVEADDLQAANLPFNNPAYTPVYKAPPQREWQGLTDEEMNEAMDYWSEPCRSAYGGAYSANIEYVDMVDTWRYIEAKLKEKNHG